MEEVKEIDLKSLAKDLMKRAWIIVLCAAIFAAGFLVYNINFVEDTYKAEITLYVVNNPANSEGMSSQNLAVALQMAKSYVKLIESDRVLEKVVEDAELTRVTAAEIRKMMSVEVVGETEVFTVSIISRDPKMSADIANAIASFAPAEIYNITKGSRVEVVDYAKVPTSRYAPNYATVTVLGALSGAAVAVIVLAIYLISDTRIKSKEDLTKICQLPVLGMIPDFAEVAKRAESDRERKEMHRK
jgi:capsular polysaccharide biosynthesis protein